MKHHRLARVAEAIREVASEAILFELKDPRVKFTTVTRAEVSADLQHAKVYVSVMGSERDQNLTLHGLRSAAGFIQSKLGERMRTRYVPVLEFVIDEGIKNSLEVARLLNEEKARADQSAVPSPESPVALDEPESGDAKSKTAD
jgi:ribosome-binding factor A